VTGWGGRGEDWGGRMWCVGGWACALRRMFFGGLEEIIDEGERGGTLDGSGDCIYCRGLFGTVLGWNVSSRHAGTGWPVMFDQLMPMSILSHLNLLTSRKNAAVMIQCFMNRVTARHEVCRCPSPNPPPSSSATSPKPPRTLSP